MFYFATPREARALHKNDTIVIINVSSRAPIPFRYLSPFYPHGNIPIPGMKGRTADSVEGIWQGLKVIHGHIDESYFQGRGKKRGVRQEVEGHKYGDRMLDYVAARKLIYIPLYRWMVTNIPLAQRVAIDLLHEGLQWDIYLHDVDSNSDVENLDQPLAHASVLANLLKENLEVIQMYQKDERFRREYDDDTNGGGTLTYPLADAIIEEQKRSSPNTQK